MRSGYVEIPEYLDWTPASRGSTVTAASRRSPSPVEPMSGTTSPRERHVREQLDRHRTPSAASPKPHDPNAGSVDAMFSNWRSMTVGGVRVLYECVAPVWTTRARLARIRTRARTLALVENGPRYRRHVRRENRRMWAEHREWMRRRVAALPPRPVPVFALQGAEPVLAGAAAASWA
jgi:hypothetical protein